MRRSLLLNGFMATGKSTLGRTIAERTESRFLDLDALLVERHGREIGELFRERGEHGFRALERAALSELLAEDSAVVALGGGALIDRDLRLRALDRAVVVTLEAPLDVVVARAVAQGGRPLLDGDDPRGRAEALLTSRAAAYAECHARIRTDSRSLDELVDDAVSVWARAPVAVAAGERSYVVDVVDGDLERTLQRVLGEAPVVIVVSDRNVSALHAERVLAPLRRDGRRHALVDLPPGEEHKTPAALESIWRAALEQGADRSALFVALGGGVVSDIAGFAAATYQRGVRWCVLPTTLLAMVDASVGGKTAVDLAGAKNVVGAFWQPSAVCCDVSLLTTEGTRGFTSALAEVVKTALLGDPPLFELLERESERVRGRDRELVREVVERSVRVKARIVSADERESGLRAVLNLGHTVGHALEAAAGLGELTHGEAVSLGLVAALRLGVQRGVTPPALATRAVALLAELGLPTRLDAVALERAVPWIGADKKRSGSSMRFVLLRDLGVPELVSVPLAQLEAAIPTLANA